MRIVRPDAEPRKYITADGAFKTYAYVSHDTTEISDAEWDILYDGYTAKYRLGFCNPDFPLWIDWHTAYPFSQYLKELISLIPELETNTFEATTKQETDTVKIGDHVKVCNCKARFWLLITLLGRGW
jgi:hypothetical protein